ncbi:MAG: hypothetical protein QXP42_00895, partial [Candidatus Micrarchaeia archaeon]
NMTFSIPRGRYEYNMTSGFSIGGSYYPWNVSCNATSYMTRADVDSVFINATQTSLEIWDETDSRGGSLPKFANDPIAFFANYTNASNGIPINKSVVSDAQCKINIYNVTQWTGWLNMTYKPLLRLWFFNMSSGFTTSAYYEWNVSCNASDYQYQHINDTVRIGYDTNLSIWDETDIQEGKKVKMPGDPVAFFANYTNSTNGAVINASAEEGAVCRINIYNVTQWTGWLNMTYNPVRGLWVFNATTGFADSGYFQYNITCRSLSYVKRTLNDTTEIGIPTNLSIWDETDPKGGGAIKYAGEQVKFWANYSNTTSQIVERWWNNSWNKRRRITVVNNNNTRPLPVNYIVSLELDTATLISNGEMLPSGNDLRVVYWNESSSSWVEIPRFVWDINAASTTIYFNITSEIPAGDYDNNYYIYYNNTDAGIPPSWSPFLNFSSYPIQSYDASQDVNSTAYEILDGGYTLHMWGNNWKALTYSLTIYANTTLDITFKSNGTAPEIEGIGVDDNLVQSSDRFYKFYGTQSWGITTYYNYTPAGWVRYHVKPGVDFTGVFNYLTFGNDADEGQATNCYFSRYIIRETVFAEPTVALGNAETRTCLISFQTSPGASSYTQWESMVYNSSSMIYEYNRSFDYNGTYIWNVSCSAYLHVPKTANDTLLLGNPTNLEIWDETDSAGGGKEIYYKQPVVFFANYTNKTNGVPINTSAIPNAKCQIRIYNVSVWTPWMDMEYNPAKELWVYNMTSGFNVSGMAYPWEVSCSALGYEYQIRNDTVFITLGSSGFTVFLPNSGCSYPKGCTTPGCTACERCYIYAANASGPIRMLNVSCEGQTSTIAFYNFRNTGGSPLSWYMRLNESLPSGFAFKVNPGSDNPNNATIISTTPTLIVADTIPGVDEYAWAYGVFSGVNGTEIRTAIHTAS